MDGIIEAIIKLWKEAHNVRYIAQKLGIIDEVTGQPDIEYVEMVIEDPANYPSRKEYLKSC